MKNTISIKKNNTFRYILKKGKYFRTNILVVYCSKNNKNINCLGICVNKKNGNSVSRNKLKRWVRQAYMNQESKLKKGYNIVVLYKKQITMDSTNFFNVYEDIKKAMEGLMLYETKK